MNQREKILLSESHAVDFDTLLRTVSGADTVSLKAPVTPEGIILLNARLDGKPTMAELSMHLQPGAIEISRCDYGGIQAFNAGVEKGPVAPMLRKPAGILRVEKSNDGDWLLDERRQDILDMCTMDYFLDIVALHALKKRPSRIDANYLATISG